MPETHWAAYGGGLATRTETGVAPLATGRPAQEAQLRGLYPRTKIFF